MRVYIDASVIVAIVGSKPTNAVVDRYVRDPAADPLVSDLTLAECSAALARNGRVKGWTETEANAFYRDMDTWSLVWAEQVAITPADVANANVYVRHKGIVLRAPDAIHIAASRRLGATLLTLDRGMAHAAATLGVNCINPAEADEPGMKD